MNIMLQLVIKLLISIRALCSKGHSEQDSMNFNKFNPPEKHANRHQGGPFTTQFFVGKNHRFISGRISRQWLIVGLCCTHCSDTKSIGQRQSSSFQNQKVFHVWAKRECCPHAPFVTSIEKKRDSELRIMDKLTPKYQECFHIRLNIFL